MKAPIPFKYYKNPGLGLCIACDKWKRLNYFYHEETNWALCITDYVDYWVNTDALQSDYNNYNQGKNW